MSGAVRYVVADGVLEMLIDRTEKRNALGPGMLADFNAALERLRDDPEVHAGLILGAGDDFCAGLDTAAFAGGEAGDMTEAGRFIRLLAGMAKPLVAGVQGRAVGVGFTLLLHCDWVIAAEDARLMAPFVQIGLTPEAGSTILLRQRVGYARAFEVLSSLRRPTGAEAEAWGLVNSAVPADRVDEAARERARALAALPPGPLQDTKRLMREAEAILATMERESPVFDRHMAALAASS